MQIATGSGSGSSCCDVVTIAARSVDARFRAIVVLRRSDLGTSFIESFQNELHHYLIRPQANLSDTYIPGRSYGGYCVCTYPEPFAAFTPEASFGDFVFLGDLR